MKYRKEYLKYNCVTVKRKAMPHVLQKKGNPSVFRVWSYSKIQTIFSSTLFEQAPKRIDAQDDRKTGCQSFSGKSMRWLPVMRRIHRLAQGIVERNLFANELLSAHMDSNTILGDRVWVPFFKTNSSHRTIEWLGLTCTIRRLTLKTFQGLRWRMQESALKENNLLSTLMKYFISTVAYISGLQNTKKFMAIAVLCLVL